MPSVHILQSPRADVQPSAGFFALPCDLQAKVLEFSDTAAILAMAQTCREGHQLIDHPLVARHLLHMASPTAAAHTPMEQLATKWGRYSRAALNRLPAYQAYTDMFFASPRTWADWLLGNPGTQRLEDDRITQLTWSPAGDRLAAGTFAGNVHLWEPGRHANRSVATLSGVGLGIQAIQFGRNSDELAVATCKHITAWRRGLCSSWQKLWSTHLDVVSVRQLAWHERSSCWRHLTNRCFGSLAAGDGADCVQKACLSEGYQHTSADLQLVLDFLPTKSLWAWPEAVPSQVTGLPDGVTRAALDGHDQSAILLIVPDDENNGYRLTGFKCHSTLQPIWSLCIDEPISRLRYSPVAQLVFLERPGRQTHVICLRSQSFGQAWRLEGGIQAISPDGARVISSQLRAATSSVREIWSYGFTLHLCRPRAQTSFVLPPDLWEYNYNGGPIIAWSTDGSQVAMADSATVQTCDLSQSMPSRHVALHKAINLLLCARGPIDNAVTSLPASNGEVFHGGIARGVGQPHS